MSQFSYATGKVTGLILIDPDNNSYQLPDIEKWKLEDMTKNNEAIALNGVRQIQTSYHGANGSFSSFVADNSLYEFFLTRRREYNQQGLSRYSTIYAFMMLEGVEYTIELSNVTLQLKNWGDFQHDKVATCEVEFQAQDVQDA